MTSIRFLICFVLLLLVACEQIAVHFTAKKQPISSQSQLATEAEQHFWNTFHQGHYNEISQVDTLLMAAYLQNPNDPQLAAHLGFLHIWKLSERGRDLPLKPTIVNEIILAKKYFSDAVELNPNDPRYLGFQGVSQLVEGDIFKDQRKQVQGFFTLKQAIKAWPEFNYFTAGFVMSHLPADSEHFREGVEWQWKTLDLCAKEKVDRTNPDFVPYMHLETQQGPQRVCWNSWIAPYNFEGFFLNMGDMLVKAGDWQTAIKIYKNAMLAKNYSTWPYRKMLEKRIANAQQNIKAFQQNSLTPPDKVLMFNSTYSCMACHQRVGG